MGRNVSFVFEKVVTFYFIFSRCFASCVVFGCLGVDVLESLLFVDVLMLMFIVDV